MRVARLGAILFWLLAPSLGTPAAGQIAPRLTGSTVIDQLQTAQHDLAVRAAGLPHSSLGATSQRLASLADALRKTLGSDAAKPIEIIAADARANAYRAYAVVQRTQAYLEASKGCLDADANAMADALATTVELVAGGTGSAKLQPVINGVETPDHRPLFVLRNSGKDTAFALVGVNLFDAQCEDPVVTATDGQGQRQNVQPSVTGVLPNRIELTLADASQLQSGSYVLHVVSRRKAFLVGCAVQPEAVATLQVAAPAKMSVSYALTATCSTPGGGQVVEQVLPAITGTMPEVSGSGTVSQRIALRGCAEPVSYAISAKVTFGDGHNASIGPISQIASAGITAGLPGGLSLSWDPSVRALFVRPAANSCKGVY
ncbi:hypothetical protein [Rhodanobacter glycinis]|uniref:hypothetical protein n=1 Tax=Rhodanobacter glycinis TaxID=582702 RepID=UPI0011285A52|nr:hypothetical protein [Rhodanobacter glycinis]